MLCEPNNVDVGDDKKPLADAYIVVQGTLLSPLDSTQPRYTPDYQ